MKYYSVVKWFEKELVFYEKFTFYKKAEEKYQELCKRNSSNFIEANGTYLISIASINGEIVETIDEKIYKVGE